MGFQWIIAITVDCGRDCFISRIFWEKGLLQITETVIAQNSTHRKESIINISPLFFSVLWPIISTQKNHPTYFLWTQNVLQLWVQQLVKIGFGFVRKLSGIAILILCANGIDHTMNTYYVPGKACLGTKKHCKW